MGRSDKVFIYTGEDNEDFIKNGIYRATPNPESIAAYDIQGEQERTITVDYPSLKIIDPYYNSARNFSYINRELRDIFTQLHDAIPTSTWVKGDDDDSWWITLAAIGPFTLKLRIVKTEKGWRAGVYVGHDDAVGRESEDPKEALSRQRGLDKLGGTPYAAASKGLSAVAKFVLNGGRMDS